MMTHSEDPQQQALLKLLEADKQALIQEPSPFFFARQERAIRERIEIKSQSWWARLGLKGGLWVSMPMRTVALALALVVSWTVFKTGRLPFDSPSQVEATASAAGELLLSADTLSLVFEIVFSGEGIPFLL